MKGHRYSPTENLSVKEIGIAYIHLLQVTLLNNIVKSIVYIHSYTYYIYYNLEKVMRSHNITKFSIL